MPGMKVLSLSAAISLATLSSPIVLAQQDVYSAESDRGALPTLFVGGYYLHPDPKRGTTERGAGWQVGAGLPIVSHLSAELNLFTSTLETGAVGSSDFYQRGGGLDLVWGFRRQNQFNPFVLAGVGGVYDDVVPQSEKKTSLYYDAGAGFTLPIFGNPSTLLRGETRYVHDRFDGGMNDWRAGLALQIILGRVSEPERIVIREVPAPRVVESLPMPLPAPVAEPLPPAPPRDSDGDGVPDDIDQCPDTLPGARVDAHGCVIQNQTVTLRNIEFDFNSARLRANSMLTLDRSVDFLKNQPGIHVQIAGHTDNVGSAAANLKLSRARAEAVRTYLRDHGVSADELDATGFGKSEPVASNDTEEGRQQNRRVEFRITAGSHG